ncbi:unnamed protein product [Cylicocyclus nassatus]|uniref:SCP domain-containing protein n=1 Tax=Cylicocyclus nassatus TaxID=53992 RepID=A0AA36GNX2_CYLNA|nr:unnamed protein product [Cylicocyclus nassatus]
MSVLPISAPAPCHLDAAVVKTVTNSHNELRASLAKRSLSAEIFGNIPGSKTLFKLKYDCLHEGLAMATIGNKCKHSRNYMEKVGRAENFITYRLVKKPNVTEQKDLFKTAMEDWINTVKRPLSSDVVYTDTSMEPFANMIYNKTLNFGCWLMFCKETSKVALACVYSSRPKIGEPLYWADSKNNAGCQNPGPCKKIIKGTGVNCDTTYGLCDQDPATTTMTSTTTTTTTTPPQEAYYNYDEDYYDDGETEIIDIR